MNATAPDTDLIAVCNAYLATWHADQARAEAGRPPAATAVQRDRLGWIVRQRARTMAGIEAKARILAALDHGSRRLAASLCRDLA